MEDAHFGMTGVRMLQSNGANGFSQHAENVRLSEAMFGTKVGLLTD